MKSVKPANTAIAYGRLSTPNKEKERRHERQIDAINTKFNLDSVDFIYEVEKGDTQWEQRKALHTQLKKAAKLGVPVHVEHSDRLIKSGDDQQINKFMQQLSSFKVEIFYAYPNVLYHRRFLKILTSVDSSSRKRRRSLVRIVDRYLQHRQLVISPFGNPDNVPALQSTAIIKSQVYYPALTSCADQLLELDPLSLSPHDFAFFTDSYLGAAYNHKSRLLRGNGRVFVPDGNRSYPSVPEHLELFAVIKSVESAPRFTRLGAPKRVSDQLVANALNAAGFRNLQNRPFSRKSLWYIRRNPAYARFCSGDLDLSFLLETAP